MILLRVAVLLAILGIAVVVVAVVAIEIYMLVFKNSPKRLKNLNFCQARESSLK